VHSRRALGGILAVALALRVVWVLYSDFSPVYGDDAGWYEFIGRALSAGRGFVNLSGEATVFWPPGYPLFLAGIYKLFGGPDVKVALLFNALLSGGTVLLVYAIGRRAFDERTAVLGAALVALFPSLIFLTGITLSETLFTFLMFLGVWLVIEADRRPNGLLFIPAGLVVGYAALTRGQAALLPLAFIPFWGVFFHRWRPALLRAVILGSLAALVVLPWAIRNYLESNSFVPISANAGFDFYIGNSEDASGHSRQLSPVATAYDNFPEAEREAKLGDDYFRQGREYMQSHPAREVILSVRKVFYLYYNDHEALAWMEGHGESQFMPRPLRIGLGWLSNTYYFASLCLAAVGITGWLSVRNPLRLLLVSLAVYWTLAHMMFFGDARFHAPIMPVFCLWAAVGVWAVLARLATQRTDLRPENVPGR